MGLIDSLNDGEGESSSEPNTTSLSGPQRRAFAGSGSTSKSSPDDSTSSSSSSSSSSTSSSRGRFRPPQSTSPGDTDESKEGEQVDVNELLREAENIDKDGSTTTVNVESSPSSGPPVHGGAGGSQPGEDPFEEPDTGSEWNPNDIGVNPGTPGLASGRETGSAGPDEDEINSTEVVGSDPREDVPGGPSPPGDETWRDQHGFGEGRPGEDPELPDVDMPEWPDGPNFEFPDPELNVEVPGAKLLAGVAAAGIAVYAGAEVLK